MASSSAAPLTLRPWARNTAFDAKRAMAEFGLRIPDAEYLVGD
jgi:hypothetical protein